MSRHNKNLNDVTLAKEKNVFQHQVYIKYYGNHFTKKGMNDMLTINKNKNDNMGYTYNPFSTKL